MSGTGTRDRKGVMGKVVTIYDATMMIMLESGAMETRNQANIREQGGKTVQKVSNQSHE